MKQCKYCSEEFKSIYKRQLYCSDKCRETYYSQKIKYQHRTNRFWIFERDGFKCVYCGKSSFKHGVVLQIDHIIPVTSNELHLHQPDNLVTACIGCNNNKHAKRINKELEKEIKDHIRQKSIDKGGLDVDKELKTGISCAPR